MVPTAPETYCCGKHPECSGNMGEKCSKCSTPYDQPIKPYACPMHPEMTGNKGDHCPKCSMEMQMVRNAQNKG